LCSRLKKVTQQTEALGRSRGGFTSKPHARCDARGCPLGFVLTGGDAHDIKGFAPLLRMVADKIEALLADKGYDADAIREELARADIEAVIPARRNRKDPTPHDPENTSGVISSSDRSTSSRTGGASRLDTTRPPSPISASSPSPQ
jgi:transposase